jgi:arylsulfatase A-like enzyme
VVAAISALLAAPAVPAASAAEQPPRPNVLLITVDTLRADRLGAYGYSRPTSPNIDRLMARGARFDQARAVEPLTNPSLTSLLTALYPHEHGATRNGLKLRPRLPSLPKLLDTQGYLTAAFIANWTLKDEISGLSEHFGRFDEVFTKKRWFGLFKGEATADDVNDEAIAWLDRYGGRRRPVFTWVHYVEPHAPYVLHEKAAERLGIDTRGPGKSDRYDTEIAYVDEAIGRLLDWLEARPAMARNTVVVFTSDHGENLGEHGYWGHGRFLWEENLRVPLAVVWPGRIPPQAVAAPAVLIDVAPTVAGLVGLESPSSFRGFDWAPVLTGGAEPPTGRTTFYQAHKGAVLSAQEARPARRNGLLEVGLMTGLRKEVVRLPSSEHRLYEIGADPGERRDLGSHLDPSSALAAWRHEVENGLATAPDLPEVSIDPESAERLRSLGYLD